MNNLLCQVERSSAYNHNPWKKVDKDVGSLGGTFVFVGEGVALGQNLPCQGMMAAELAYNMAVVGGVVADAVAGVGAGGGAGPRTEAGAGAIAHGGWWGRSWRHLTEMKTSPETWVRMCLKYPLT